MKGKYEIIYQAAMVSMLFVLVACQSASRKIDEKNSLTYRVIGIRDGDTFDLLMEEKKVGVRLGDIDCPEKSQPFGKAAKQFASNLCFGKQVKLVTENKSAGWGRIVGWVYVDDTICVNKELVKAGLAWQYDKYSKDDEYRRLEDEAHKKSIGLWVDKNPTPPWDWRKKD